MSTLGQAIEQTVRGYLDKHRLELENRLRVLEELVAHDPKDALRRSQALTFVRDLSMEACIPWKADHTTGTCTDAGRVPQCATCRARAVLTP